jgi:acetyltransferase-like isoleucine patch superfamily enzyme
MRGRRIRSRIRGLLIRWFGFDIVRVNVPTEHISRGKDCYIDPTVVFAGCTNNIRLGNRVSIGRNVWIQCHDAESLIEIGDETVIKPNAMLMTYPGGKIVLGSHCSVNPFCVLYGHGGLVIGSHVRIATHTVIIPAEHRFDDPTQYVTDQGITGKGVVIGDDVWIGAGTMILDGCEIGSGCVIGAGSVVTQSLEAYSVAVGAPCKFLKRRGANISGL